MALGTCPACAGRHRPHTYAEGCKKKKESIASGAVAPPTVPPVPSLSPARVLAGPPLEGSSDGPRPPGLEPPLGVSSDDSSPHERSEGNLQKPKKTTSAMFQIHSRLRNPAELLKLHLKHDHMSFAQFRHRTSSLRLPEDIHELYTDVVQDCEHCIKKSHVCREAK